MPQSTVPQIKDNEQTSTDHKILNQIPACLGTVLTRIRFANGSVSRILRGFCDTGAQVNLITESCVQTMQLRREKIRVPIAGLGSSTTAYGIVNIILTHRTDDNVRIPLTALVVHHITGTIPEASIDSPFDDLIPADELSDPGYKSPGKVDILLGAEAWAAIIGQKMHRKCTNGRYAIAHSTALGWTVFGYMPTAAQVPFKSCQAVINIDDARIDQMLIKFWNADALPKERQWTIDEQRAEEIFITTHRRESDGRYTVTMPFVTNKQPLGDSARMAKACFLGIEKRLHREPSLFLQYKSVFDDYREKRHMVLAPKQPPEPSLSYHIPHHAINTDGIKGKFRVVFNASAASSSGVSLNDQQLAGPKLQDDLNTIFLRFRALRFGVTADIKQMFRQVNIAPEHWNYQRIHWRDSPKDELKEYVTTVVCWGQKSAGFNAVRAVRQCAIDEQQKFPIGSHAALNDLYFDDLLSGARSEADLLIVHQQVSQLLLSGGFELSKWATNSKSLAMTIANDAVSEYQLPIDAGVLGMHWKTGPDTLQIKLTQNIDIPDDELTKRNVISATSQIFDPTGLVLPVIVVGKILQQDLWRSGIGWDAPLPAHLVAKWHEYRRAIDQLDRVSIPRWLKTTTFDGVQLHIFTDASELAMGAVAYFRIPNQDNTFTIRLITARSKVAPIKRVTIPRLEFMAALSGAELSKFIRQTYRLPDIETYFWTDSTIAVHWLRRDPATCKPFIANRIIAIREAGENGIWQHVKGIDNPADLLTRGASAEQLRNNALWWTGPAWLAQQIQDWPTPQVSTLTPEQQAIIKAENRSATTADMIETHRSKSKLFVGVVINRTTKPLSVSTKEGVETPIVSRRSELSSLLRSTAYVHRFIRNSRARAQNRKATQQPYPTSKPVIDCDRSTIPAINNTERREALRYWIAHAQHTYYHAEIAALKDDKKLSRTSPIIKLLPYVDTNGFLRVGGRLANADISEESKHPLILPPQARISQLIVHDAHYTTVHGGPQLMLAYLRRSVWITRARQVVKSIVHHCPICVRYDQPQNTQLMGDLPSERVTRAECFLHTGLDFAGPFEIRKQPGRPPAVDRCSKQPVTTTLKAWIVIFICLSTKAVHIDVLIGLTIEEFLAAFERFTMRKGRCQKLISDNGTTFVGADKELARVLASWSKTLPQQNLSQFGTDWKFITPAAPFKGGLWEAAVKSMKRHLKRAIGVKILTKDELYQMAVHIEGCLNSRPLWPMSDDPTDPTPLTPAHFVLGKPILPQPVTEDVSDTPSNRLTVWGQRQKLQQQFWRRWHTEYLCERQVRTKWYDIKKNLKTGDMVVIMKEHSLPAQWIIGKVIEVYPDRNGLVRSARIKTPTGELERPVNKLVFLPQPQPISVDLPINGGEC